MKIRKVRDARDLFVQPRVVLHCARAEWIHALIDRIIPRRHAGEVPHDVDFSDLGHAGEIVVALKFARDDFIER